MFRKHVEFLEVSQSIRVIHPTQNTKIQFLQQFFITVEIRRLKIKIVEKKTSVWSTIRVDGKKRNVFRAPGRPDTKPRDSGHESSNFERVREIGGGALSGRNLPIVPFVDG